MTPTNKARPLAKTPPPGRLVRAGRSLATLTRATLGAQPLQRPMVDPQILRLSSIERAAEVLRYSTVRAEYWLSPGGTLRAVIRLSVKSALLLGLPVLIVGPVILLLLEGAVAAAAALAMIAANIAALSISLLSAAVGFAVLAALGRTFVHRK